MAELSVAAATDENSSTIDAIGPETYSFNELVKMIARIVHSRAAIVHLPSSIALAAATALGWIVGDVMLTPDEVRGLAANLLVTQSEPKGATRLSEWLSQNADRVGRSYASELAKHYR
jgi:NADH dehydrogenase